ncbi:MAG: hypothetical protein ACTHOK_17160 [Nocardioidaceae bacterium]
MYVIATLNDRLQPQDRAERYEDPLGLLLETRGLGKVTGGGSRQSLQGEIEQVDVEIELDDPAEQRLELVTKALEVLGAPVGSALRVGEQELPFGRLEGLGLYLNGTDLPDEVYANADVNVVLGRLEALLGDDGSLHSSWEGPTETALYFYGDSFATMAERIAGVVDTEPLCQRARVVRLA